MTRFLSKSSMEGMKFEELNNISYPLSLVWVADKDVITAELLTCFTKEACRIEGFGQWRQRKQSWQGVRGQFPVLGGPFAALG